MMTKKYSSMKNIINFDEIAYNSYLSEKKIWLKLI